MLSEMSDNDYVISLIGGSLKSYNNRSREQNGSGQGLVMVVVEEIEDREILVKGKEFQLLGECILMYIYSDEYILMYSTVIIFNEMIEYYLSLLRE